MNGITDGLVALAATMVIVNQVRTWRTRRDATAAAKGLEEYTRKVQAEAVRILGLMREATYQAQEQANLREDLRIAREVPEEFRQPVASMRPKTAAQKARLARAARVGNKG